MREKVTGPGTGIQHLLDLLHPLRRSHMRVTQSRLLCDSIHIFRLLISHFLHPITFDGLPQKLNLPEIFTHDLPDLLSPLYYVYVLRVQR